MTNKNAFTEDDWSLLRETPPLAGMWVAVADNRNSVRETIAIAKVYGDAHERWWMTGRRGGLIDELLDEGPVFDGSRYGSVDQLDGAALIDTATKYLNEAVSLLERKATPEELGEYQTFVLTLAQRVAEAQREGGVLGFGGTRVNTDKQAALEEIAAAFPALPDAAEDTEDTEDTASTETTNDAPAESTENAH